MKRTRVTSRLKYLGPLAVASLFLTSSVSLATSQDLSPTSLHIFLYEDGVVVDETVLYSYAEPHLISMATQQIVGETISGDPMTLYDTTGQPLGFLGYVPDE